MEMKKKISVILLLFLLVFVIGCREKPSVDAEKITDKIMGTSSASSGDYNCEMKQKQREFSDEQYYTGPLIDTHLHMPVASSIVSNTARQMGFEDMPFRGDLTTDDIVCLLDSEGITKAFGFFMMHNAVLDSSVNALQEDVKKHSGKFAAFFMPPFPVKGQAPEVSSVENTLKNNPGLYQGYGEARFDFKIIENAKPDDEYFLEMYRLADKYNLIVQIHPDKGQVPALERLLKEFPNVKFLVHLMVSDRKEVPRLLETYGNVYYSLDAEIHYIFGYHTIQDNNGPTKEEYLASIRKNFDSWLTEAQRDWKLLIEAHPDQFTWGSDRWFTWHFDPEVSGLVVEFGRTFIGQLDPAVQEKFAYKNAETMLKNK